MESPALQAYLAKLTGIAAGFSQLVRVVARIVFRILDQGASCALASGHQHFLKRDAVFSNVLVYSGCSAFRFPKCTQQLSHLTTSGGQHGQESEEVKEGEERSEEDCEEDPSGLQEEEVNFV